MSRAIVADKIKTFRRDDRGATAILFALIFVPVLCMALTAIDYGRAYYARNKLQAAADSAVSAGVKMLGMPHEAVGETVLAFLKANTRQDRKLPPYEVVIAPNDTALTVRIKDSIATTAAGIVGIPQLAIAVESTAARPAPVLVPDRGEAGPTGDAQPALPPNPALDRAPTPEEMRNAEAAVRDVLEDLERNGGGDVRDLLRALRQQR